MQKISNETRKKWDFKKQKNLKNYEIKEGNFEYDKFKKISLFEA